MGLVEVPRQVHAKSEPAEVAPLQLISVEQRS